MKKIFLYCTLYILTMFPVSFAYGFDANDAREHLADRFLGDPNAPITIYEYSSFTCPHCARFHATAFPQLRSNYIDTGKVKLVYRDFPLDRPAVFAGLLSRCIEPENIRKYYGMIDVLFRDREYWVVGEESDYLKKLRIIGRRAGLTNQQVRDCRNSQPFVDLLLEKRYQYEVQLDIISTPTFIFNNNERRIVGAQPYEVFTVMIEDLLQKHGHTQDSPVTQELSTEAIPSTGFDAKDAREHLEDRFLGDPNAPITIYEYSSFTCPHCARFHATAFPQLRSNYIDTGKVKLVYRDFPLDRPAVFAGLLSRCIEPENIRKYYGMVDVLFRDREYWVVGEESDYLKRLRIIGRRAGLTNQQVRDCRNSQPFVDLLLEKRYQYEVQLDIISTPTFIFNDNERRIVGAQPYEVFRVTIEDLLQKHGHTPDSPTTQDSPATQELSTEAIPSTEVSTSIEDSGNLAGQMQMSFAYGFDAKDAQEHLEDRFLGDPNAPITIYEYSSFTCLQCARFQATVFPQLRKDYIDTGKVKLVYRDFPLDRPAVFASLLSRCVKPENIRKYYRMIDVLFRDREYWMVGEESDYLKKLRIIGRRAGLTNQQIRDCRNSQPFVDLLLEKRYQYGVQLNISSTPTFIFNDNERRLVGAQPYEEFRVTIEDLLQKHDHTQEINEEGNSSPERRHKTLWRHI